MYYFYFNLNILLGLPSRLLEHHSVEEDYCSNHNFVHDCIFLHNIYVHLHILSSLRR